jgi:hypothetical protein
MKLEALSSVFQPAEAMEKSTITIRVMSVNNPSLHACNSFADPRWRAELKAQSRAEPPAWIQAWSGFSVWL